MKMIIITIVITTITIDIDDGDGVGDDDDDDYYYYFSFVSLFLKLLFLCFFFNFKVKESPEKAPKKPNSGIRTTIAETKLQQTAPRMFGVAPSPNVSITPVWNNSN